MDEEYIYRIPLCEFEGVTVPVAFGGHAVTQVKLAREGEPARTRLALLRTSTLTSNYVCEHFQRRSTYITA